MEISTFVRYRPTWRGVVFVIVVVLGAAGVAGYLTYREPATWDASAAVFVGQILPSDVPDYLLRPVADNYQAALGLPRVVRAASKASGESEAAIDSTLSSERVSSTANVDVFYSSTRRKAAKEVVRVASRQALIALAHKDLARSERAERSASGDYQSASQALAGYEATNGDDGSVRHSELAADVDRTLEALTTARGSVDDARLEVEEATSGSVVSVKKPARQSRVPDSARAAATAGLIAAMVAFILLLIVDWRRRPKVRWAAPAEPGALGRGPATP
ncbi:MAG TPA: hypothetical protein VIH82_05385 [Acidimicrobiia bacterium]|jgi:hypothetical protein